MSYTLLKTEPVVNPPERRNTGRGMVCFCCGDDIIIGEDFVSSSYGEDAHEECLATASLEKIFEFFGETFRPRIL